MSIGVWLGYLGNSSTVPLPEGTVEETGTAAEERVLLSSTYLFCAHFASIHIHSYLFALIPLFLYLVSFLLFRSRVFRKILVHELHVVLRKCN